MTTSKEGTEGRKLKSTLADQKEPDPADPADPAASLGHEVPLAVQCEPKSNLRTIVTSEGRFAVDYLPAK